ncbi:MAG: ABC transporter ATP-binding protein [Planctomycetes bacterium]|nr:ABC transporter ATP-binding protein [Planctomycetota bacterium]
MSPDALAHLLGEDDARERRHSSRELLGRLAPYYREVRGKLLLAGALLLTVIGLGLAGPFLLGQVIDVATAARPPSLPVPAGRPGVIVLALCFVGAVGLSFLLEASLGFLMSRVGVSMVIRLKQDLFRKVLSLDPDFFRDYPPGKLIARVESDTESLKNLFSSTALQLLRASLTFGAIFVCMLLLDARTTLILLPVLCLIGVSTAFFVRYVRSFFVLARRYYAAITGLITEYLQGIEVVRHHDYAAQAEAQLEHVQRARAAVLIKADFFNYSFWGFFGFCEVATAAIVIGVGAEQVRQGTLSVGTLVVFLEYLRQVFMPIQLLSEFVSQVQRGFVAAGRIFGILSLETKVPDAPDAEPAPPLEQAVCFEDVRFSYDGQTEALRGVSFEIPCGKSIALVGPSGGGKSTLVQLLLRYQDPSAGRITVDGRDLRQLQRRSWRAQLGYVPQEVYLFPGTLGENVSVFDARASEAQLMAACRAVEAEDLVRSRAAGLDTPLVERGANLSLGERQLVSLARAFVTEPRLLVLDEATSSVDPETEGRIQRSLDRLLAGRTALIVAHRLETIRACDEILFVDQGQIVERGGHDELWARGGRYRKLAERQFAPVGGGDA